MDYSKTQQVTVIAAGCAVKLLSPTERLNHVIWHAQVGNLSHTLHQISLHDMLDASVLSDTGAIDLTLPEARATKAKLQGPFSDFVTAQNQLLRTPRTQYQESIWVRTAMERLTTPPSQQIRMLELGLHYLKAGISNPARLIDGLRALCIQGIRGHARRMLTRRTGSSKR